MRIHRLLTIIGLFLPFVLLEACGNSSASSHPLPTITSVKVSPPNATILVGSQQQFNAQVDGTGNFSPAVTWSVNGVVGGNSNIGTISSTGNYVAPAFVNAAFNATITAVSDVDTSKSGSSQANIVVGIVSSVSIDPTSQNVYAGSSQMFTSSVQGTGSVNPNVTWMVNGIPFGNSTVGTMSPGPGSFYTAPDVIPNPSTVTITATSVQDTTKAATASATIVPPPLGIISVAVNPYQANMPAGQTQTFTANVIGVGSFNPAVTWSIGATGTDVGAISTSGVYTPPNDLADPTTVTITATSLPDPSKTASAYVQVFPAPVITSITPNPAQAGDQASINGTNLYFVTGVQFTGPNNLTLPVPSFGTGVAVPFSAITGPMSVVTQVPGFAPVITNSLPFTRTPALRIRAANRDLSAGESTLFSYRVFGVSGPQTIQWTADTGSIDSSASYQAPGSLPNDTFATIQGCLSGTQVCQSEILGLHPFRISPYPADVAGGDSLQMDVLVGGFPQSATWTNLTTAGSLNSGGSYTAGTTIADSGGIPISATLGGISENATIGVTGKVPGIVGEISDYVDYSLSLPLGTYNEQVAISGHYLYALAAGKLGGYYDRGLYWIDVYDITDPTHPVWVDAAETAMRGHLYARGQYLYQAEGGVIAIFSIAGTTPVLISEKATTAWTNLTYYDGVFWATTGYSDDHDTVMLAEFDLRSGNVVERDLQLTIPNGIGPLSSVGSAPTGTDARLYLFNYITDTAQNVSSELDTYDVTTTPPTLLERQSLSPAQPAGVLMGSFIVAGNEIFDLSGGLPQLSSTLPAASWGAPIGFNGKQLLTDTYMNGLHVTDLTDLTQPKFAGLLFEKTQAFQMATWSGQYVISADQDIRVYDAAPGGGAVDKGPLLDIGELTVDQLIHQSRLFMAAVTDVNAFVSILDLTVNPPKELGRFDTGEANPFSVQVSGTTMYVGTDQGLVVVDVSNPGTPAQIRSIPGAVNALAIAGTFLYVGTNDGHLVAYNISQPKSPVQTSIQALPVGPVVLRTGSGLLFVVDDTSGLLTFSLATPGTPAFASQFLSGSAVGDAAVDGNLVLLATFDQGLVIVDMTNPMQPLQIGQAVVPAYGFTSGSAITDGITVANKVVYIGTWIDVGNIYGFDYSVPAHPRMVSIMPEGGQICDYILTLQNDTTDLFDGVTDIDLSMPRNVINYYPIFAKSITNTVGNPCDVAASAAAHPTTAKRSYNARRSNLKTPKR